jgi:hypothetical protein
MWLVAMPTAVYAWDSVGHHVTGMIASELLSGSRAERETQRILGDVSLRDAAVWADCAKGIDPAQDYRYTAYDKYPECKRFESAAEIAYMQSFVKRTQAACQEPATGVVCHKRYHYTDLPVHFRHYDRRWDGTRSDDLIGVTVAAIRYLRDEVKQTTVTFNGKREALLVLIHCVGDLHQPLHVASVFLDTNGQQLNPDLYADSARDGNTMGGNRLLLAQTDMNLHRLWDTVPRAWLLKGDTRDWLREAHAIPSTSGQPLSWPALWADDTLAAGRATFSGLQFEPESTGTWRVRLPYAYAARMHRIQRMNLIKAGARLALLLKALWP